jgi:hypothetical protein
MSQDFFNALSNYDSAIKNADAAIKANTRQGRTTWYEGGIAGHQSRIAARDQAIQNKNNYLKEYVEKASKDETPYMGEDFTPTDWSKKTADYNAQIDALKRQGMDWNEWRRRNNKNHREASGQGFRLNDGVQAQIDELTRQRDNLPTLIAAEKAGIGAAQVVKQRNADIRAEDIQIQERAQNRNRMANNTLARMNRTQQTDDAQKAAAQAAVGGADSRGVGPAYDIQKQREAGQQKVGAAMSAAPGVSGFAGKAAAVSPVNATSQTANTGVIKGLNKNLDLGQIVANRANFDAASGGEFSGDRSKAPNMGSPNSFVPPNTQGIQIGEAPINKY